MFPKRLHMSLQQPYSKLDRLCINLIAVRVVAGPVLFILGFITVVGVAPSVALAQTPTVSPVGSAQSTPAAMPTAAPTEWINTRQLDYDSALSTYEKVAVAAIEASKSTLELTKWLVGALLALSVLAASTAAYLFKASADAGQKAQLAQAAAQRAEVAAASTQDRLEALSERYASLGGTISLSLDAAIRAANRGEISQNRLMEIQQLHSWRKWSEYQDETGRLELAAWAKSPDRLCPLVFGLVESDLDRLDRILAQSHSLTEEQATRRRHLQVLVELASAKSIRDG